MRSLEKIKDEFESVKGGARINGTEIPIGIFMKIRKRLYVDI